MDNINDKEYVKNLIYQMTFINLWNYTERNVIYAYIISLKRDHKDILIKIGFTDDFIRRHGELTDEFQCGIFLVGIRAINRQADEKKMHTLLKRIFPKNIENVNISGTNKMEVYKFSLALFRQFNGTGELINTNAIKAQEVINNIQNQRYNFPDNVNQELVMPTTNTSPSNINNLIIPHINNPEIIKYYLNLQVHAQAQTQIQINKDNNNHQLVMLNRLEELEKKEHQKKPKLLHEPTKSGSKSSKSKPSKSKSSKSKSSKSKSSKSKSIKSKSSKSGSKSSNSGSKSNATNKLVATNQIKKVVTKKSNVITL